MIGTGSAVVGALTGIFGSLFTNLFNLLGSKTRNKHEIEMAKIRIEELKAESEAKVQQVRIESEVQQELAAQESFNISQRYGNRSLINSEMIELLFQKKWTSWLGSILIFIMGIIDVIRAAMRPAITIMLMLITGYIVMDHLQILEANKNLLTNEMLVMIIDSIIYLTFTVVGWWFGDRTIGKYVHKK